MKKLFFTVFLLALLLINSGCVTQVQTVNTSDLTSSPSVEINNEVSNVKISNFAFNPTELTINVGSSVNWINEDSAPHTIKSEIFTSPELIKGESYLYQFSDKGIYEYFCGIHPSMKGKITVK